MFVNERFELQNTQDVRSITPKFGWPESGFGEYIYYRFYSRTIRDEWGNQIGQENWHDTVIRVINGLMSVRKDWYVKNYIQWDESRWQDLATKMAISLCRMEWLPPGRGLWAMGSDAVYERGAMPLYNCAYTHVGHDWIEDLCWLMDSLMNGAGVGFKPIRNGLRLTEPTTWHEYVIPDTREGWVESIRQLLNAFVTGSMPRFIYDEIRPKGSPIITFGGIASGPEPLMLAHERIERLCYKYVREDCDEMMFKADLANIEGVCVVSGNVRRGAEICCGDPNDEVFWNLKNYKLNPERAAWGWMSNNSVVMTEPEHFEMLSVIGYACSNGHDVGFINGKNLKHGRLGKFDDDVRFDFADGFNPCGEIPLESREVCNLAETLPTRCVDEDTWLDACGYATIYTSTVSLLPTHQPTTNAIIARNRRIGVSIIDYTGWVSENGVAACIRQMREGYKTIRRSNRELAAEAGIPESIRVTTIKPGGTVPKLAGRTSGASHPTHRYVLRRVNTGKDTPVDRVLRAAGMPFEESVYTPDTHVYAFPVEFGPADPATTVSIWEQAMNIVTLQREWADNAVSNTLYFKPMWVPVPGACIVEGENGYIVNGQPCPCDMDWNDEGEKYRFDFEQKRLFRYNPNHEEGELEAVLAHIAPYVKSVSLLPHSTSGLFAQSPEEGITRERYSQLLKELPVIDWSTFENSDGEDEKYCTGEACTWK